MDVQTDMGVISCPPDDMARYYAEGYEPALMAFLYQHVQPGWLVGQVGAHVGYVTRLLSRLVGPEGVVIAFEPDPITLDHLAINTADFENVTIYPYAIGPRERKRARWWRSETNSGCNTWGNAPPPQAPLIGKYVVVKRLSQFGPFDFILTDAQGWDAEILEEYISIWDMPPGGAVIEVWADGCKARGMDTHEQISHLATMTSSQTPIEGDPGALNQNWFLT